MKEYKVGDKAWYVPRNGCIAIECTIVELDDFWRKADPGCYIFYWVDEPVGHSLADDELFTKEEALELLESEEEETLEEYRETTKKFIMSTWNEENPKWTEEYPDKKAGIQWFNFSMLRKI